MNGEQPGIGRTVHFVLAGGQHRAATVTNAFGGSRANLTVHLDQMNDLVPTGEVKFDLLPSSAGKGLTPGTLAVGSAQQDEDDKAPGTWHWPEVSFAGGAT